MPIERSLRPTHNPHIMPFWGLVITSTGFAVPAILAWRKRKRGLSRAMVALTTTSVLYHGTQLPWIRHIDHLYAHTLGFVLGCNSFTALVFRPSRRTILMAGLAAATGWLYFCRSARTTGLESCFWHMGVHASGITTAICHVCGS